MSNLTKFIDIKSNYNFPNVTWSENSCIIHNTDDSLKNYELFTTVYNYVKANYSLSGHNRFTIFLTPGIYKNPTNVAFELDTDYINVMSLSGERDVIFDLTFVGDPFSYGDSTYSPVLVIDCDNIHIKGIKAATINSPNFEMERGTLEYILPIIIDYSSVRTNMTIENCLGGFGSFGSFLSDSSYDMNTTFIKCESNFNSFGYNYNNRITSTFINCRSISESFVVCDDEIYSNSSVSNTKFIDCELTSDIGFVHGYFTEVDYCSFINCKGETNLFHTYNGYFASCDFKNCEASDFSFNSDSFKLCVLENCKGGDNSFTISYNSFNPIFEIVTDCIFENCKAGDNSFGGAFSIFSGSKFINCISGNNSFGGLNSTISSDVYFENCTGGNTCFGGGVDDADCTVSGTFINCKAGDNSFGGGRLGGSAIDDIGRVICDGTFINCTGGAFCFGGTNGVFPLLSVVGGIYENCKADNNSFGGSSFIVIDGTLKNCIAGNNSFGGGGTITIAGILENCKAGDNSFGSGDNSIISGTLKNCEAGLNSFCAGSSGNSISGDLYNCVIGSGLNNTDISITGRLFYCHLKNGTFPVVSGGGRTYYCIDGNGDSNNQ